MKQRLPYGEITLQEIAEFYPALAFVAGQTLRLNPLDPETAEWLDGPAFVKWLKRDGHYSGYRNSPLTDAQGRQINRWENGGVADVYTVDRILTVLEVGLCEIPDEVWIRRPVRPSRSPIGNGKRQEIVVRFLDGESADSLSEEFGISPQSIRQWARAG